jgi:hypothetical protein
MSYLLLSCSFCLFVVTFCWCLIGFRLPLSVCRLLLFTGNRLLARNGYLRSLVAISVAYLLLPSLLLLNHYYCHPWLLYCHQLYCQLWKPLSCQPVHSLRINPFSPRQFVVASVGSSSNFAKWLPGSADGILLVSSALADAVFVYAAIAPGSGLACAPSPMG